MTQCGDVQERVDQLEKELALKEAQIVAMQKQGAPGGSRGGDGGEEPSQESLDDFVCQFKNEVKNLQEWLTRFGYAQRDMVLLPPTHPLCLPALAAFPWAHKRYNHRSCCSVLVLLRPERQTLLSATQPTQRRPGFAIRIPVVEGSQS